MRKIVILIAISAFILGLDCLPAPAQKTITVMLLPQYVRELNDLLIDQMNEWAKQKGVKVRADVVSTREAETRQMAEMAAGEGHDVRRGKGGTIVPLYPHERLSSGERGGGKGERVRLAPPALLFYPPNIHPTVLFHILSRSFPRTSTMNLSRDSCPLV